MQLSHDPAKVSAVFDEANLVSCAGLAPVVALAARAGLEDLVARTVTVPGKNGANASVKVAALVAGMVAGADCIDDMDLLRHGAMPRLFTPTPPRQRWPPRSPTAATRSSSRSSPT